MTRFGVVSAIALTFLIASGAWAIDPPFASASLATVEFSVGSSGTGVGLPSSGVRMELITEGVTPSGATETFDDIYAQFYSPPGAFGYTNIKEYDDGGPVVGGPGILPEPPSSLTIRTALDSADIDSFAVLSTGAVVVVTPDPASTALTAAGPRWIQFSVDATSVGVPFAAPDVASEAGGGEALGDIFEGCGPGGPGSPVAPGSSLTPSPGGNSLISDEGAHGLTAFPASPDNLDALIVNNWSLANGLVTNTDDTDGLSSPDMPLIFFTFNPAAPTPAGFVSGADLYVPGLAFGGPALDPFVDCPAGNLGLLSADNIDALFIDTGGMSVIFSLAPGSPSLATIANPFTGVPGATPSDLIHVSPGMSLPHGGGVMGPATPPAVCLLGADIGLAPGDNLDALWISADPHLAPLVPVELSVFHAD